MFLQVLARALMACQLLQQRSAHLLQTCDFLLNKLQLVADRLVHALELSNFPRRLRLLAIGHLELMAFILRLENLANIGQREAEQIAQIFNALQALNVILRIAAVIALGAPGGWKQADLLVIAQRALGQAGLRRHLLNGERWHTLRRRSWILFSHHNKPSPAMARLRISLDINMYKFTIRLPLTSMLRMKGRAGKGRVGYGSLVPCVRCTLEGILRNRKLHD